MTLIALAGGVGQENMARHLTPILSDGYNVKQVEQ